MTQKEILLEESRLVAEAIADLESKLELAQAQLSRLYVMQDVFNQASENTVPEDGQELIEFPPSD